MNTTKSTLQSILRTLLLTLLVAAVPVGAQTIYTLTNSDTINTSSFSTGTGATNWDSGAAPAPGADYFVASGRTLRTPGNNTTAYTFQGGNLLVAGSLLMKGSNIITVPSLTLSNGVVQNGDPGVNPRTTRIAGNINVLGASRLAATETNRILEVTAALSGSGALTINDRGLVTLTGPHTYAGPITITAATLDLSSTTVINPSGLVVGLNTSVLNNTNFFQGATNIVRAGGSLNVGPGSDLRIGWRSNANTNYNPTGVLDLSAQSAFTANINNMTIGYSSAASSNTPASALGIFYGATNNSITAATSIVMGDTTEGTHPSQHLWVLGKGSNYIDTPTMTIGARKQRVLMTLPAGGSLLLTNSVSGRMDLTIGGNNVGTSASPTDTMDLSGGPTVASLGSLILGQKTGGVSGGVTATLTTASNSATAIDVNDLTLGTMSGNVSGTTAARGTLNFNGGAFTVNNNVALGFWDATFGTADGRLNINGGTFNLGGSIVLGGGTGSVTVNSGNLNFLYGGSLTADTLINHGIVTNVSAVTVGTLSGTGSTLGQLGLNTVTNKLSPGTDTTAGTLRMGSLSLDPAATFAVNLADVTTVGSGVNDLLTIDGDVTLNNAALQVSLLSGSLANGTYRLINYTGELLGTLQLPSVGRYTLSLVNNTDTNPKQLNLVVSGNPLQLRWGGELSSAWDNSTLNWTNRANNNPSLFLIADGVLFDDFSFNPNVSIDVPAAFPSSITFSNDGNPYTITGAGKISGATGISKNGYAATSIATTNNDFTGPVVINGGTLVASSSTALGATNGTTTVANGGALDVNAQNLSSPGEIVHAQGSGPAGAGAIVNGNTGAEARNALRYLVLDGDTTVGGANRWDVRGTAPANGYIQGGSYTLTKVGESSFGITDNTAVECGNILVNSGAVLFESGSTMNSNATITVDGSYAISPGAFSMYRLNTPVGRNITLANSGMLRGTSNTTNTQNTVTGTVTLSTLGVFDVSGGAFLNLVGPVTGDALSKTGTGIAQLLHPANTWTGGTTISAGSLSVGDGVVNGSLPALPDVINTVSPGTLMYNVVSNTTITTAHEIAGTGGFIKRGDGTINLTRSNSFSGGVTTGNGTPTNIGTPGGILRLLNPYAFGDPSISKTVSIIRAEVRLEGGITIPPTVYLQTSALSNVGGFGVGLVALRNVAGNNSVPGPIELVGGAGNSEYSSDAGLLALDGPIYLGNTSSRGAIFSGLGTGIVNGLISNEPTNSLSVEKRGPGVWTFTAANTYFGPTTVTAGTLLINGSIAGTGATVVTNATLGGTGVINAPLTVNLGGTVAPGTSVGTLTVNSNVTINGFARMEIARNGATLSNDRLFVSGTNTWGAASTLVVTNVGTSPLQPGDSFQLFAAGTYVGTPPTIVYPVGYVFTNSLAIDGRVGVASIGAPPSVPLSYTIVGNSIQFSWTGSYKLQAQTNTIGVGLSTNWYPYPGGHVSPITVPISTANGAVFYSLTLAP